VIVMVVPLLVLGALDKEKYWLSLAFGILFVGLSDPGGTYAVRVREMAWVGAVGTFLTALGFALGGGPWGWVVLAAFVVTFISALALKYGVHRFTSALMLNSWFLVCIAVPAGLHENAAHSDWSGQALAWLIGSAVWIALTFGSWLARGRKAQASHFPEIPGDMAATTLTRPVVMFTLIKAIAVTIAVAIAFGFHLPNANWMPIATLVALKGTLDQSTLVAEQRLIGALIGAAVAAIFLLTVDSKHVLEAVIIVLASLAGAVRGVNYAIYCAAMAALVLIAAGLSHPSNLRGEVDRVLFTFAGVGIAWLVMLLVNRIQKAAANTAT
jgi:uncharacterized membrane protein YccC